ncbi:MAG: DUF6377 domain-containing protein [Paludibacteraceae bacterium]|nr:DUF6377 domain-containing protein [Paludibacteraceae bacterium]
MASQDYNVLLDTLDHVVNNKQTYFFQKDNHLNYLKAQYKSARDKESKFSALQSIIEEYKTYNLDSMLTYAKKCKDLAEKLEPDWHIQLANIYYAEGLCSAGMFKESAELLGYASSTKLDSIVRPQYYHVMHTLFDVMYNNSIDKDYKNYYRSMSRRYADSILSVYDTLSFVYLIVRSDIHYKSNKCNEALADLQKIDINTLSQHNKAIYSYCMANVYRCSGDSINEIYWLAKASLYEIPLAVREYSALQELAVLLYKNNDIERSYMYLSCAIDDVNKTHFRMREREVAYAFPIVQKAYAKQMHKRNVQLIVTILMIGIILFFMIVLIIQLWQQLKSNKELKAQTEKYAQELIKTNNNLKEINERYTLLNNELEFNVMVKMKYLTQYMSLSSTYLEQICTIKNKIQSVARTNPEQKAILNKLVEDLNIENVTDDFYENFDNIFLSLFPNFITQFNDLLEEDKRVVPPDEPNRLNTPLRIFALIRLGMTDSVQISIFLKYSLSTIYNYRVRYRNYAIKDREHFEDEVMKIK